MAHRPLVIGIADLRRQPGTRRHVTEEIVLPGLGISAAVVPDDRPIRLDVELETLSNGLVATGTVTVPWEGDCRRCMDPVRGESVAEIREIFEPRPTEGETYPLGDDLVDLEPMVRDAALLALPLAPLCSTDCAGPAPESFPTGPSGGASELGDGSDHDGERPPDPRWAALSELDFESGDDDE